MTTTTPPMAVHTGYRLIKVGELLLDLAETALAPIDIRPRHFNVMVTLTAHADYSQQQLSRLLGIDVNGMVTVIDHLEGAGLAVRERNINDRRRHVVRLTESGLDVVRRGTEAVESAEREFLSVLSEHEISQLHGMVGRLMRIEDEPEAPAAPAQTTRSRR